MRDCCECHKQKDLIPICNLGDDYYDEDEGVDAYICSKCIERSDEFGFCEFCGEGNAYYRVVLNKLSECREHRGESNQVYDE